MIKGIYCIKVNDAIVYVGKTKALSTRVQQHFDAILAARNKENKENKYRLLRDAFNKQYKITFWLLEQCETEKLNDKEAFWIKQLKPCLNSLHNSNCGRDLSLQEFYDVVQNEKHDVSEMIDYCDIERPHYNAIALRYPRGKNLTEKEIE